MTNEEEARTDMPAPASQVLHGAWDIYSRGDETSPELIAFDFDAAQRDLSDELPHCALIRIQTKNPTPRGEPVGPEVETLYDMQDALVNSLQQQAITCRLVARVTYGGTRELLFGLSDWDQFRPPVGRWMSEHADYEMDVDEYPDWDFYDHHVRPTAEVLEYVEDRRTIDHIVNSGVNPSEQRVIDFFFHGAPTDVTAATQALHRRGYTTNEINTDDAEPNTINLEAHKHMTLDELYDETRQHRTLAEQQRITYDGWGTSLAQPTST